MKKILVASLFMLFAVSITFAQATQNDVQVDYKAQSEPIKEVLYVVIVENNLENKEQISKFESSSVTVIEDGQKLKLLYKGVELTSEMEPDFIKAVKVYKGADAQSRYPNHVKEGGVIELELLETADIGTIYKSFRTN